MLDTLPLTQTARGDLDRELAATRRVLERVPDAEWTWKPHEKSMALGQLAAHTANLLHSPPRAAHGVSAHA